MSLVALGLSHKSAEIGIRERFSLSKEDILELTWQLTQKVGVKEAFLLSTCNRTELYTWSPPIRSLWNWLEEHSEISLIRQDRSLWYQHTHLLGIQHLMRVASGLDSMALGEVEILGQLKAAFFVAKDAGGIGKYLGHLFNQVFSVAKTIRTQTAISVNPISLAHVGAQMATKIFANLAKTQVLLIGAGETARLCAKHLIDRGVEHIIIANRTYERAANLALDLMVKTELIDLTEIACRIQEADIVISSTASPLPIIGKGLMERVIKQRKHQSVFMLDLAVPRDIEPEVGQLEDIYLYGIDDLQNVANQNHASRVLAAEQAEMIVLTASLEFLAWLKLQKVLPRVCAFREHYQKLQENMVKSALKEIKTGREPEKAVEELALKLTNRFLHDPTIFLKQACLKEDEKGLAVFSELFKL